MTPESLRPIVDRLNQSHSLVMEFRGGELGQRCEEAKRDLIPYLHESIGAGDLEFGAKAGALLLLLGDKRGNDGLVDALSSEDWCTLVTVFLLIASLSAPENSWMSEHRPSDSPIEWLRIYDAVEPHLRLMDVFKARTGAEALRFCRDSEVADAIIEVLPILKPQVLVRAVLPMVGSSKESVGLEVLERLIENEEFTKNPSDFPEDSEWEMAEELADGDDFVDVESEPYEHPLDPTDITDAIEPFLKTERGEIEGKASRLLKRYIDRLREAVVQMAPSAPENGMTRYDHYVNNIDNACANGLTALTEERCRSDLELLDGFLSTPILRCARPTVFSYHFRITGEISQPWLRQLATDLCLRHDLNDSALRTLAEDGIDTLPICQALAESLPENPTQQDLTVVTQAFASIGELKEEYTSRLAEVNPMLASSVHWLRHKIGTKEALKKIEESGIAPALSKEQAEFLTQERWPLSGALFWSYAAFSAAEIFLYIDLEGGIVEDPCSSHFVAEHAPLIDGLAFISGGFIEAGSCKTPSPTSERVAITFRAGGSDTTCEVKAMGDWMDLKPILTVANTVLCKEGRDERLFTITPDGQCAAIVYAPAAAFEQLCRDLGIGIEPLDPDKDP